MFEILIKNNPNAFSDVISIYLKSPKEKFSVHLKKYIDSLVQQVFSDLWSYIQGNKDSVE